MPFRGPIAHLYLVLDNIPLLGGTEVYSSCTSGRASRLLPGNRAVINIFVQDFV